MKKLLFFTVFIASIQLDGMQSNDSSHVRRGIIPHSLSRASRLQEFLGQLDLDELSVENFDFKFEKIVYLERMITKIERFELSIIVRQVQDDYTLRTRKYFYKEQLAKLLTSK